MGQISAFLRNVVDGGYAHWCPGCEEMHVIGSGWTFNGDLKLPTFSPSVRVTGKQTIKVDGRWTGDWARDSNGEPLDLCCHYFLIAGNVQFCGDSTHSLAGQTVPLPELPDWLQDPRAIEAEITEVVMAADGPAATANFSAIAVEICEARAG